jgi:hypothetical protein
MFTRSRTFILVAIIYILGVPLHATTAYGESESIARHILNLNELSSISIICSHDTEMR